MSGVLVSPLARRSFPLSVGHGMITRVASRASPLSGFSVMQTLRIFISSPGDVAE
ncbi:MAG: hypothetical protein RLZZ326_512, partial [Planctomycetota bacterium]